MPYEDHAIFRQEGIAKQKLWRYTDFSKFLHLLENKALFFSCLVELADSDKSEGLYGEYNRKLFQVKFDELPNEVRDSFGVTDEKSWKGIQAATDSIIRHTELSRGQLAVNCWHADDHESVAMWKIYGRDTHGLCIQTTLDRLKNCFAPHKDDSIYIGAVTYLDYETELIPMNNAFFPAISKRREFKYESEVRSILWRFPKTPGPDLSYARTIGKGVLVNVDIPVLFERIYISPYASQYVRDLVPKMLKKYGLTVEVIVSKL